MAADVVLDSSLIVASHNARDIHHEPARRMLDEILSERWGRALLLEYVVLEVATVLRARRDHATASRVLTTLLDAHEVDYVPCSDFFQQTLAVFLGEASAALSFTDAAIAHVARSRSAAVATFDADFAKLDGVSLVQT